jgi:hypothetical protein
VHHLDGALVDILGWALVFAVLSALAGILAVIGRARATRKRTSATPARLGRDREWALVTQRAARELARAPRLEELQADATVTIESAEYAYNRLLLDCAKHCKAAAAAVPEAAPALAQPSAETPERPAEQRPPLAA